MPSEPAVAKADDLKPIRNENFGFAQARHLLWRAGFGGTPEQVQTLVSWGPERSVEYLVNPDGVAYDRPADVDAGIMRPPSQDERRAINRARQQRDEEALAQLRLERQRRQRADRTQVRDIQKWWLTRMIETPRPLEEKMTLFWHGHFATSYRKTENSYHMLMQNELFRREALGSYAELMHAIIRDPAMLRYLDNNNSRSNAPNENLARELMELFSLGEGHYSERDIKEGARALTGYTYRFNEFVFEERNHDDGVKSLLGSRGAFDGDGFVKLILAKDACAAHMTRKLYRYFVADLPSDERDTDATTRRYLRRLAAVWSSNRFRMKPMLKRMLLSEHFYHPSVMGQQIKSPVQLVVGAVRSLNAPPRDLSILLDALDLMGQNLLMPPSVKGWDGGRSWINTSTLYVRQNILNFLLTGKKPAGYDPLADAQRFDPEPLLAALARAEPGAEHDPQRVAEYMLRFTIGGAPAHARDTLGRFHERVRGAPAASVITGALLLITAMPEYQLT